MGFAWTVADKEKFNGVFSLLLTPFLPNGEIDWKAYDAYVDWQLSTLPNGLFAVCGTSEMNWLTAEERLTLAARAVKQAGSVPVTATANVGETRELHKDELKRMEETGVSGVVLVPPPSAGMSEQQKFEYYAELTDASHLPVFVYEWPARPDHLLDCSLYGRLVHEAGIAGIKDTTCTLEGIAAKIAAAPESVVYQANMAFMLEAMEAGAGAECIHSAAASQLVVDLWRAVNGGERERAAALHATLVFLNAVLSGFHPALSKYLACLQGQQMSLSCRGPVKPLAKDKVKALEVFRQFCLSDMAL